MRPDEKKLLTHAGAIYDAAVAAVEPAASVRRVLSCHDGGVYCDGIRIGGGPVYVLAFGKAAFPMAAEVLARCGDLVRAGVVIAPRGAHKKSLPEKIAVYTASHPLPEAAAVQATEHVLRLAEKIEHDATVIVALSGGTSALLVSPQPPITVADKRTVSRLLLESGADIGQINTVRKALSRVKGGRLAAKLRAARILNVIISDVVGDDPAIIGSGPTVSSPVGREHALAVCRELGIEEKLPYRVRDLLLSPEPERPVLPPGDRIVTKIVANNARALAAAQQQADALGYRPMILTTGLQCEARVAGELIAAIAKDCHDHGWPLAPPCCILAGGETTVTVRGRGKGGRNQELALAAIPRLRGAGQIGLLAAGTDGVDGTTDAAGAFVTSMTAEKVETLGLSVPAALQENDSYTLLSSIGQLFKPGHTGTNVMDITIVLIKE